MSYAINSPTLVELKVEAFWSRPKAPRQFFEPTFKATIKVDDTKARRRCRNSKKLSFYKHEIASTDGGRASNGFLQVISTLNFLSITECVGNSKFDSSMVVDTNSCGIH